MCGIAGALDLTGLREFPTRRLLAMTQAIAHRGPDDEQIHIEPGVALGARRLAIIDLANGRQPIANETGHIWAVFNGELFDYPKVRRTLLARGHQMRTECDTELWVHLYEDHAEAMFERTRGQFAVSLWDRNRRTLILGRDRMGICPLYYTEHDGWLLWASEIKALLASGCVPVSPDRKGIDYLFNFFCAGSNRTYFEGIKSIPPGHFLRIKQGHLDLRRYWDLDFPDAGEERLLVDPRPLVDELESLLQRAVQLRLRSDVPVVSYLSGGLDSTIILGIGNGQQKHGAIPAFSIGLDNAGPDERKQSIESAQVLGSELTTLVLNQSKIAHALPELIKACEGPILDTSCAAMMLLAAEVNNQGYKVALTGEGADEALAGYIWFKTQKIGDWLGTSMPQWIRKAMQFSIHRQGITHGRMVPADGVSGIRPAQQYMYEMVSLARETLYSEQMWESLKGYDPYRDLDIQNDRIERWHPLNQSLYVGYKVMLAGLLMISKGDRIAMNSSIETRYPFLDEDVVNFCASIAPAYKLRGMTEKWLLRQVAARILPAKIAHRSKTMFRTNLSRLFLGPERPVWVDQLLSVESLQRTGYFDPNAVAHERWLQNSLPRFLPRRLIFDAALTCVVSTQLWHHLFIGGGLCELPIWQPT